MEEEKIVDESTYDLYDYPLPYDNVALLEGWFDFNDSSVIPILPGRVAR